MKRIFCRSATVGLNSTLLAVGLTAMAATSAVAQPASKFSAHVAQAGENMHLLESGVADTTLVSNAMQCAKGDLFFDLLTAGGVCVKAGNVDTILEATIKTANKSDLLIGVSLQSGLYTDTTVKGKNGSSEAAGAQAGVLVRVEVDGLAANGAPATAYPETVVFANRIQELKATLGGVIKSCDVTLIHEDTDGVPDGGEIVIGRDCVVTEEEIQLILSTTSAGHFNFVAPNLAPGVHQVRVVATALSSAAFLNGTFTVDGLSEMDCEGQGGQVDSENDTCLFTTVDNSARGWVVIDVGSLTVEQVRATNQEGGIIIDLPEAAP